MKSLNPNLILLTGVLAVLASPGQAQDIAGPPESIPQFLQNESITQIRSDQLMGINRSFCGHVIRLMRHNRFRRPNEQLRLPHLSVGLNPGDLTLTEILRVSPGHAECGPVFQLTLHNCSNVPIGNFEVSIVGVARRIQIHSPTANATIQRIEAGQELTVQMQLPAACMSMICQDGPRPFDHLIVALDSYDVLLESDEANNIHILKREEIGDLATPVPQNVQPLAPVDVPASPAPEVDVPQENDRNIDLDQLDLRDTLR